VCVFVCWCLCVCVCVSASISSPLTVAALAMSGHLPVSLVCCVEDPLTPLLPSLPPLSPPAVTSLPYINSMSSCLALKLCLFPSFTNLLALSLSLSPLSARNFLHHIPVHL